MADLPELAAHLVPPGAGLLALDQTLEDVTPVLRGAGLRATEAHRVALHDLVLATAGLHRTVTGVILDAGRLAGDAAAITPARSGRPVAPIILAPEDRRANRPRRPAADAPGSASIVPTSTVPDAAGPGRSPVVLPGGAAAVLPEHAARGTGPGCLVGVRLRPRAERDPGGLADEVARHVGAGAAFARVRVEFAAHADRTSEARERAWLAAEAALACQQGGLVPFVDCAVRVPRRSRLADAERIHGAALGLLVSALEVCGVDPAALVLGVSLVGPGRRAPQVEDSIDVARATLRSLDQARVPEVAGLVCRPAGQPRHLVAHIAALQWMQPPWPLAFCPGRSLLEPVAAAWRGREERAEAAQREALLRLTGAVHALRAGRAEVQRRQGQAWWD